VKQLAARLLPAELLVCRGPANGRRIALSFDDGPAALTHAYLDVLDAFGAKATFFLVGARSALRPEEVSEISRRGHEIGNHGYTHRTFPELSRDELIGELENTAALLPPPRGRRLVRPPRGAVSAGALVASALAGYTTALWSYDSNDWRVHDADAIGDSLQQASITPGEILLFHEDQAWTLAALPGILRHLNEEGHELVTLSDLLRG
jgi:peptidoglycan/xylan/chitin deacetylase (PgdA/CDA1 family)